MNESFNHAGAWGITLIVIVLVSWFFYRYFAPKSWREWAGAGVVQAFIIALYAEMYGFPLTIYLLVRFFGLDSEYVSASLWSTLVGLGETGMVISMLLGYALAFTGIGLFIQGGARSISTGRKSSGDRRVVCVCAASAVYGTIHRFVR